MSFEIYVRIWSSDTEYLVEDKAPCHGDEA